MQFGCLLIHKPLVIFFPNKKPLTKAEEGEKNKERRDKESVLGEEKKAYGMKIFACSIKKEVSKKQKWLFAGSEKEGY